MAVFSLLSTLRAKKLYKGLRIHEKKKTLSSLPKKKKKLELYKHNKCITFGVVLCNDITVVLNFILHPFQYMNLHLR